MRISIKFLLVVILSFLTLFINAGDKPNLKSLKTGWDMVPEILSRIIPPVFPDKEFDIKNYGASGDGVTDCTNAINKAIDECSASGGGRVVVPEGRFLTGAIKLKSNVNLHLSEGAVMLFSTDPEKYMPVVFTRWECIEAYSFSALIYAFEQENVAVTGNGILDGQASYSNWWKMNAYSGKDTIALNIMGRDNVSVEQRVFGLGHKLRPNFLQLIRCKNVLIQDVTIKNSPMWTIHPVYCRNVTIEDVNVFGDGPNTDGCDPDSCADVLIKNSKFSTGDDCIVVKSGRDYDGRRVNIPSENIVIQNCTMENGHGGITCGSETAGGIRNVFGENCLMSSPKLDMPVRFKSNADRGGFIENVYIRNITVSQAAISAIHLTMKYGGITKGKYPPVIRNIEIRDSNFSNVPQAIFIEGTNNKKVNDLRIINCNFEKIKDKNIIVDIMNLKTDKVYINGELAKISRNL